MKYVVSVYGISKDRKIVAKSVSDPITEELDPSWLNQSVLIEDIKAGMKPSDAAPHSVLLLLTNIK